MARSIPFPQMERLTMPGVSTNTSQGMQAGASVHQLNRPDSGLTAESRLFSVVLYR
jgi:hypothetical protein